MHRGTAIRGDVAPATLNGKPDKGADSCRQKRPLRLPWRRSRREAPSGGYPPLSKCQHLGERLMGRHLLNDGCRYPKGALVFHWEKKGVAKTPSNGGNNCILKILTNCGIPSRGALLARSSMRGQYSWMPMRLRICLCRVCSQL
jgi:hypothetical protein